MPVAPLGMMATPLPATKQLLAQALCAYGHVAGRVSTVRDRHNLATLTAMVWEAQRQAGSLEQEREELEGAGDGDGSDDGERSSARGSMPMQSRNSSWGSGSGMVSEVENVEEQAQAQLGAHAMGQSIKAGGARRRLGSRFLDT